MERFLYQFGFETPRQAVLNREHMWDDADSAAVFIDAEDEAAAKAWGHVLMEGFLDWMYSSSPGVSWRDSDYGCSGVDRRGSEDFSAFEKLETPVVAVGSFPDWSRVSAHRQPETFEGPIVPPLLTRLIAAGRWPCIAAEVRAQNLNPLVSVDRVRALAPEEETIHLLSPPFRTVQEGVTGGESFWTKSIAAPDQLVFDKALVIGDFGLGSDSPIVLDYRGSATEPCVLRLLWQGRGDANQWVALAPDFDTFARALGFVDVA